MKFVDVSEDSMDGYDYVGELLDQGYRLPLTVINDNAKTHGSISAYKVHQLIKQEL